MKGALDWGRLLAALLVIAIHTSPLGSFNAEADFVLTRIVARLAVPFFMLCSGYFLLGEAGAAPGRFRRFAHKTLLLYAGASLLYLPLNLYAGHWQGLGLADWLRLSPFTICGICRRFCWGPGCWLFVVGCPGNASWGWQRPFICWACWAIAIMACWLICRPCRRLIRRCFSFFPTLATAYFMHRFFCC